MDLITHALLSGAAGAAIARTAALRTAAATAAAAGLLPDADVLIAARSDPLLNLEFHRHFTHSLAFAPLGAAVVAALAWLVLRRRTPWPALYAYACAGYLAAILLDACTSYGTHLFWPLPLAPVALSVVSVLDPLVTVLVGVPLALALRRRGPRLARLAVALAVAYIGLGGVQHHRAAERAAELAASRGHAPQRSLVKPTLGNLVLWRSLYLDDGHLYADAVRVALPGSVRVYPGESEPRFDVRAEASLPQGSRARRDVERFVTFADDLAVRHPSRADMIGDARYAMLPTRLEPLWGVVFDARAPEAPVRFETLRDPSARTRQRFIDMLLGRELAEPAGAAAGPGERAAGRR